MNRVRMSDLHMSDRRCRGCGRPLCWRKRSFLRPDQYFDWTLDVWCPFCGAAPTDEDLAAVRAEYDELVAEEISEEQAANLRRRLGPVVAYLVGAGHGHDL